MDIRHDGARGTGLSGLAGSGAHGELQRSDEPRRLVGASDAADHVRALCLGDGPSLMALYLGEDFKLLATERLRRGNAVCPIKPMRVVRQAHRLGAIGFVLVHFDNAGTSGPDAEELRITRELRLLGEDFGIYLFQHLLVGADRCREVAA